MTDKDFPGVATLGETIKPKFYEELAQINTDELIGKSFRLDKLSEKIDWDYDDGRTGAFYFGKITLPDGSEKRLLLGGTAIVKQVTRIASNRGLPVVCKIGTRTGSNGTYKVLE